MIALVAAGVFFVVKNFAGKVSGGDKYVFLKDEAYYLTSDLEKDNEVELASAKVDYPSENMVRFSPDDKYVYYYTKIEEDNGTGSLCRAEISKLKKDSSKNDNYIETIASNVSMYPGFRFLKNGNVIYKNGENSLYCFDGKDSTRIGKNVYDFYTDKDSKVLYTVGQEEYDYEGDYVVNYDLYGIDIKNKDSNIKMAKDISYIMDHNDFNNIYFTKDDEEGNSSIYVAGFDKEETSKVCNNAGTYRVVNGNLFYISPNGNELRLADYLVYKGEDEWVQEQINAEEPKQIYKLCMYKNGEEIVIADNVINANIDEGMIAFNTTDMITEKISFNDDMAFDIDNMDDSIFDDRGEINYNVYSKLGFYGVNYAKAKYVMTEKTDEIIQMSDNVATKLLGSEDAYLEFYVIGSKVYVSTEGEVFEATLDGGQITDVTSKSEGYIIGNDDNDLYVMTNDNSGFADINIITNGETKNLAKGVEVEYLSLYEDGTLFGFTDYNFEGGYGDLEMFDSKGGNNKIGTDVSQFIRKGKNDVLFVSNDNLFSFNGKDKKQLKNDVTQVWCSNYEKKTNTLNGRRGY